MLTYKSLSSHTSIAKKNIRKEKEKEKKYK